MANGAAVSSEVAKSLETAIEALRWCRQHLQDRTVSQKMRELEQTLGAVALALDYDMDGQSNKAQVALEHASWRNGSPRADLDLLSQYDH